MFLLYYLVKLKYIIMPIIIISLFLTIFMFINSYSLKSANRNVLTQINSNY